MTKHSSALVIGLTFVATLGGLLFGYDTAVISGAVSSIKTDFIVPLHWSEFWSNALSGLAISAALIGCIIGSGVAGGIGSWLGRKGGLLVAAALFLVSAVGSAYPELGLGRIGGMGAAAVVPFIVYRIICGIGVGMASMLSPLYIAEIAPSEIRGRLVSFNQLSIVLGMLVVYFVNLLIQQQGDVEWLNSTGWRFMLLSEAVPALLFMLLLMFVPDTPRWLVMKGRSSQALSILSRLSGEEEAKKTVTEIEESLQVEGSSAKASLFAFGTLVLWVGILLSVFQQLVGINAVLYYAPQMFANMGASTNASFLQTVVVGAANVLFTVVAILTVDRLGRRPLMIAGALVMAVAMISLGFLFYANSVGMLALGAVLLYIAGFALSWGPVTWVLLAEIFPNAIKNQAMAMAVAAQWIANLVISISFPVVDGASSLNALFHHGFAYWIYGAMSLLAAAFVYWYVPETKQKTLEEIQALWTRRSPGTASQEQLIEHAGHPRRT